MCGTFEESILVFLLLTNVDQLRYEIKLSGWGGRANDRPCFLPMYRFGRSLQEQKDSTYRFGECFSHLGRKISWRYPDLQLSSATFAPDRHLSPTFDAS